MTVFVLNEKEATLLQNVSWSAMWPLGSYSKCTLVGNQQVFTYFIGPIDGKKGEPSNRSNTAGYTSHVLALVFEE